MNTLKIFNGGSTFIIGFLLVTIGLSIAGNHKDLTITVPLLLIVSLLYLGVNAIIEKIGTTEQVTNAEKTANAEKPAEK
jgi:hypothetical protein